MSAFIHHVLKSRPVKHFPLMLLTVMIAAGGAFTVRMLGWTTQGSAGQQTSGAGMGSDEGRELFRTYCANCHGLAGQGNGPLAQALRRPPSDLTQIASANGDVFPEARIFRIIDGREVETHGDREMPVWGDAFKTSRQGFSEESVRDRINALIEFLKAIQRRQV